MTKDTSQILGHIIEIKERLGGIEEHLRTLNGKVIKNQTDIAEHYAESKICHTDIDKKLENINVTLAKWGTAFGIVFVLVQLAIKVYL